MRLKRLFVLFYLLLFCISCIFASNTKSYESKMNALDNNKDVTFNFDKCDFIARFGDNYATLKIKYNSGSDTKEFSLICDSYVELLSIIKINEQLYWFKCEALGFEQFFIWDLKTDIVFEPFFDMKDTVYISTIDFENQVLFGDTWNSDKGIMPDQKIELYLFSTSRKEHYKIAEKYGESFTLTLLGKNKIQYNDNSGKQIVFDYSAWIKNEIEYSASSFLIEGKTKYCPENLASQKGLPWASANGYGINDTIQIKIPSYKNQKLSFYNGFQSESRKDLFLANSRAKKIEIKCLQTNKIIKTELKDIRDKQIIDLSDLLIKNGSCIDLEIKIIEVYPGDKYKDLCIQAIIPVY